MGSKTNQFLMKKLLLIISLFFCLNSFGQKLPITGLCLSDVLAVTGGTCLADAFTNANSSYFDATYAVAGGNWLDDFRNYGPATSCPSVGDSYGGGIVAYLYQSGDPGYVAGQCHGIIVSTSDQSSAATWWNGSSILVNTTSAAYGSGTSNTSYIVSAQGSGSYAAKICYDLVAGGYSDWVLPSSDDLNKINLNKGLIGTFTTNDEYWSSTESLYYQPLYRATGVQFTGSSNTFQDWKYNSYKVRAVRYF